jgi:predicted metal-dependent HD superfamily phosphohydrolase
MLKQIFLELASQYTGNTKLQMQLWNEIETSYSNKKRHYHSLAHLRHIIDELDAVKNEINSRNTVLLSVFYHDLVYNPLRRDNEERSNIIAEDRLSSIEVPTSIIEAVKAQILATKKHDGTGDADTVLFTDADLSILGQAPEVYFDYAAAIRKEYSLYSDMLYNPGRKAVLQTFLERKTIFHSPYFQEKYERQARKNIAEELQLFQAIA